MKVRFHRGDRVRRKRDGKKLTVLQTYTDVTGAYPQDILVKERFLFSDPQNPKKSIYKFLKMWHTVEGYEKIS